MSLSRDRILIQDEPEGKDRDAGIDHQHGRFRSTSLEQIRAFLDGGGEVRFAGQHRQEVYLWVEQTLVRHQ